MPAVGFLRSLIDHAAYEATETGSAIDIRAWEVVDIILRVSAITGAPTSLNVKLQGGESDSLLGDFKTAIAFAEVTSAAIYVPMRIGVLGVPWIRAIGTIVGGSSSKTYTFGVYAAGRAPHV